MIESEAIILTKKCGTCKGIKPVSEFGVDCSRRDGLAIRCKACNRIRSSAYSKTELGKAARKRSNESPLDKIRHQRYYVNHKVERNAKNKEYRETSEYDKLSREKYRKEYQESGRSTANHRRRRREDLDFRFLTQLRSRVNSALKGSVKNHKTKTLLSCTIAHLKQHLESQFTEGMTWENYGRGGWHVDHIVPCSYFDLSIEENQFICFHYLNLQPLWWRDNLTKSGKVPDNALDIIQQIKENLNENADLYRDKIAN